MPQDLVIIVDDKGNEHEFPAGFDPKRAASIVRQQTAPKGGERTRADTNIIGFDQGKWSNMASKLPEKVMGVPVRYPVAFAGSLAGTAMEALSAPESLATAGMGRMPDALPPGRPNPQLAGIRAAAGVAAKEGVKDIPVVRRWVRRADKISDAYKDAANAARKAPDIVPPESVRIPPAPPKPTIDVSPRELPSGRYTGPQTLQTPRALPGGPTTPRQIGPATTIQGPQTLRETQSLPSGPSMPRQIGPATSIQGPQTLRTPQTLPSGPPAPRQIGPAQSIQLGRGDGPPSAPARPTPSTTPEVRARPTTGSASVATTTSARLPQSSPVASAPPAAESTPTATPKPSVRATRVKTPSTKGAKFAEGNTGGDALASIQRDAYGKVSKTAPNGAAAPGLMKKGPTLPSAGSVPAEAKNARGGLNPGWRFAEVGATNPDVLRRSFTTPEQLANYTPAKGWKLVLRAPDGRIFPVAGNE